MLCGLGRSSRALGGFISGKCSVVVCPTGCGGARIGATAGTATLAGPRVGAGVKDGVVDISHPF